jgi:hypothetical protein
MNKVAKKSLLFFVSIFISFFIRYVSSFEQPSEIRKTSENEREIRYERAKGKEEILTTIKKEIFLTSIT